MESQLFRRGLSYIFRQRLHGKDSSDTVPELVKPESAWEGTESVIEEILRWADDGGKMLELGNQTARSNRDAARERANE